MILILSDQEKETLLYALLVGVTCAANDVEHVRAQARDANEDGDTTEASAFSAQADEIEKLAVRCKHLLAKAQNTQ